MNHPLPPIDPVGLSALIEEQELSKADLLNYLRQMSEIPAHDRLVLAAAGVGMLPMWLYMLTPWIDFAGMGLPAVARIAGLCAAVFGVLVLDRSHRALGSSWSPVVEAPIGGLVTGGVYRFVRHPMYSSFLLFNAGEWLLTSNWLAGAPAVLSMLWLYLDRVDKEERTMLELFGGDYLAYAAKTGRLAPRLGRRRVAGMSVAEFADSEARESAAQRAHRADAAS